MASEHLINSEEDAVRLMVEVVMDLRLTGSADPDQQAALENWMMLHPETMEAYDRLADPYWLALKDSGFRRGPEHSTEVYQQLLSKIRPFQQSEAFDIEVEPPLKRISHRVFYLTTAAAIVLIAVSAYLIKYTFHREPVASSPVALVQDLAPGTNKAVLTLANGSTVDLDSAHAGLTLQQGKTRIVNQAGGRLAYEGKDNTATLYNTITTGRGGQYRIVLSDGTKAWLDASSSLKYPTTFSGATREVTLTGQGYFEVAHHKEPFIVHTVGEDVKDLGTAFNINAYPEEEGVKTTLLSGSVQINGSVVLKPGQQARLSSGGLQVSDDVDTDEVIAWKEGRFQFTGVAFGRVLDYLSRWYDVRVIDKSGISNQHVVITIPRDQPLSAFMHSLELTHRLTYQITDNGKTLIITP